MIPNGTVAYPHSEEARLVKRTLATPILKPKGHRLETEAGRMYLVNPDGWRVGVSDINNDPTPYDPGISDHDELIEWVVSLERIPMPGVVATITGITFNEGNGSIGVEWSDGSGDNYPAVVDLDTDVDPYDTNTLHAKRLALLRARRMYPNIADIGQAVGLSCTIDGAAATPVSYTIPPQ